jgi:hypothetical protein
MECGARGEARSKNQKKSVMGEDESSLESLGTTISLIKKEIEAAAPAAFGECNQSVPRVPPASNLSPRVGSK